MRRYLFRVATFVLIVVVVYAIAGCTRDVDPGVNMRCDTPETVYLDNNDFACWLASHPEASGAG